MAAKFLDVDDIGSPPVGGVPLGRLFVRRIPTRPVLRSIGAASHTWAPGCRQAAGPGELEVTGVDDAELILIEVPLQLRPMGVWAS